MSEAAVPPAPSRAAASEAPGSRPLIEARGVRKEFTIGTRRLLVLRDVNLRVEPGGMVAIVGASGSGKSTLLHLLGALDEPTAGSIAYDGIDLTQLGDDELAAFRNHTIGFVFQFHHLLPELTAFENVLMPALIARLGRAEGRDRALALLERVGLSDRLDHHPGELSGGEQQRVALARALMMAPRVILADEPTGNLDGRTAAEMHDLMEELNRETGAAFVIVSHNPEFAGRMGRVLRMADGVVTAEAAA